MSAKPEKPKKPDVVDSKVRPKKDSLKGTTSNKRGAKLGDAKRSGT